MSVLLISELVNEFILYKVNRCGSTNSTRLTYASILGEFTRCIPISKVEDLTLDVIDTYVDGISLMDYKPKTFKNKVVVIRSFVRYLYMKNLTDIRPESIILPKVLEMEANFLDTDEQKTILKGCETLRDKAIVYTLMASGLRVSELIEMRTDDLFERSIVVRCGKGKKPRVTFITKECEDMVTEYLATKTKTFYLFTNLSGDKLSRQYVHRIVKTAALHIDKKVSPHTLRHTFATNLLRKGARIEDVKPIMGHANIQTTMLYMHFTNGYLHDRYDEFMDK